MPQVIDGAVDLASLDLEDAALAIPRHAEGQAAAMSVMLNRALQADHIRSPPRQLRTTDGAKRPELTQHIDALQDVGLALAVIPHEDIQARPADQFQALKVAEIAGLQGHQPHTRSHEDRTEC